LIALGNQQSRIPIFGTHLAAADPERRAQAAA